LLRGEAGLGGFAGEGVSMFAILGGSGAAFNGCVVLIRGRSVVLTHLSFGLLAEAGAPKGSGVSLHGGVLSRRFRRRPVLSWSNLSMQAALPNSDIPMFLSG